MGLQAQYNKEQAEYSTELSKEMWDYTNYENQVKHLKAAGLNPALLYGQGGGGGSSAGGGTAAGVGLPTSTGVGMAIQWETMEAQKELVKAEAAKTNAEAAKLMTTDTENVKSETEKNKQEIEESKKRIESLTSQIHKTNEESKILEFNNYLNEAKQRLIGKNGETYAEALSFLDWEIIDRNKEVALKEIKEAMNDERIATKLSEAIDEIAEGKIAVFGKMVEEAKQAQNETARQKWQFEQDKALSDLINDLGGEGKYGKLLTAIISAIFNKWSGFGGKR